MTNNHTFSYSLKLDFFWRAISLYAVALLAYGFIKGSFEYSYITIQFNDPIAILLAIFIVASALSLLFNWYANREIIIDEKSITFKNRWRERKITIENIEAIGFLRERIVKGAKSRKLPVKVVRIRTKDFSRPIRFRMSSYQNEKKLYEDMSRLKEKLKSLKNKTH